MRRTTALFSSGDMSLSFLRFGRCSISLRRVTEDPRSAYGRNLPSSDCGLGVWSLWREKITHLRDARRPAACYAFSGDGRVLTPRPDRRTDYDSRYYDPTRRAGLRRGQASVLGGIGGAGTAASGGPRP